MFSPRKICFNQEKYVFTKKNMFSPRKIRSHQEKYFFTKKNMFSPRKICFHQEKTYFHQKKDTKWVFFKLKKKKLGHGFDLWSCFFLQFLRFFLFLPVCSSFFPLFIQFILQIKSRSLALIALALFYLDL